MDRLELYKRIKDFAYSLILREIPLLNSLEASIYAAQLTKLAMERGSLEEEKLKEEIVKYVINLRDSIFSNFSSLEGKGG